MHVGFTLVQNSLDYGFFRGIVPHSKAKWSERRWLPRGWSCSRQKTNQLNQRVLPAVYLLRQNDSVMKIIWSPLNNWNPPLDIPQPILSLVFFFFFLQVRDYIRVQQREKTCPSGGFSDRHKDTRAATFNLLPPRDSCREKNVKPLKVKG